MKVHHYHYYVEIFHGETSMGNASGIVKSEHKPVRTVPEMERLIIADIEKQCRASGDSEQEAHSFCKVVTKMHVMSFNSL